MENNSEVISESNPYSSFRQPSSGTNPKKSRIFYIIGIVNLFLIIIIVSGIFWFNKSQSTSGLQKGKNTVNESEKPQTTDSQTAETQNFQANISEEGDLSIKTDAASDKPPWVASLSSLEQSFFDVPKGDAADEEKGKFVQLLRQNTKTSDQLIMKEGCRPDNLVFSVSVLLEVSIKNDDSLDHTVRFLKEGSFTISPGEAVNVKIDEFRKGRVFGYACDEMPLVGFMVVPV